MTLTEERMGEDIGNEVFDLLGRYGGKRLALLVEGGVRIWVQEEGLDSEHLACLEARIPWKEVGEAFFEGWNRERKGRLRREGKELVLERCIPFDVPLEEEVSLFLDELFHLLEALEGRRPNRP